MAAFSGAFFAYVFIEIGSAISARRERKNRSFGELVRLDRLFNNCIETLAANRSLLTNAIELLRGSPPSPFPARFRLFPVRDEAAINLLNPIHTQDVFEMMVSLRRTNADLEMFNRSLERIEDRFLGEDMAESKAESLLGPIAHGLEQYRMSLDLVAAELKVIIAKNRLWVNLEKPFTVRVRDWLWQGRPLDSARIMAEVVKYERDIDEVAGKRRGDQPSQGDSPRRS